MRVEAGGWAVGAGGRAGGHPLKHLGTKVSGLLID